MATKEKKGLPEGWEVPMGAAAQAILKRIVNASLDWVERVDRDLFLSAAWIYTNESADNIKLWTQGSFLAGATLLENIADHLPVWEWMREVIERAGPDLPNLVSQYFKLRQARGTLNFPPDFKPLTSDEAKKKLAQFGTKVQEAFRARLEKSIPIFARLRQRWDDLVARLKGDGEFRHHSYKAFRQAFLDANDEERELIVAAFWGPPNAEEDQRLLSEQELWNFKKAHEYFGDKEKLEKMARMKRRHLRFFLAMEDQDDWFNFLSPDLKKKFKAIVTDGYQTTGHLADDLGGWNDRMERRLDIRKTNQQIQQGVTTGILLMIGAIACFMGGRPLPGTILSVVVVAMAIYFLLALRKQHKETANG